MKHRIGASGLVTTLLGLMMMASVPDRASAQTFDWNNFNGTNSSPGQWTTATNWNAPPVFGPDTILTFGGSSTQLASGYTMINDALTSAKSLVFNLNGTPYSTFGAPAAVATPIAMVLSLGSSPGQSLSLSGSLVQNGNGLVQLQDGGLGLGFLNIPAAAPLQVTGTGLGEIRITAQIQGGGAAGGIVVDANPAAIKPFHSGQSLVLTGVNGFVGDVVLNNGNLALGYAGTAASASPLGSAANKLIINPGQNSLRFVASNPALPIVAMPVPNPVVLNGTMTVSSNDAFAANFVGGISGNGGIQLNNNFGPGGLGLPPLLNIQSPATFTGSVVIKPFNGQNGNIAISSNAATLTDGTLATTDIQLFPGGGLSIDNTVLNVANRLNAATALISQRGTVALTARNLAGSSATESIASFATGGASLLLLTPTANSGATFTMGSLVRLQSGTIEFRGNGLGGTVGANNVANVIITANPGGQTPGSNTAGTQNLAVLPYAYGNSASGSPTSVSTIYDLVRWDAGTGKIVPLNRATEYADAAAFAAPATAGLNYRVVGLSGAPSGGAVATSAATNINGLLLDSDFSASGKILGASLGGSGVLNLSGPIVEATTGISIPSSSGYIPSLIVNGGVSFGSHTGYIYGTRNGGDQLGIPSPIAGSAGVVKGGAFGVNTLFAGANTFTGGLTVNAGSVQFDSDVNLGAAGAGITLNSGTQEGLIYGVVPLYGSSQASSITITRPLTLGPAGGAISTTARNTPLNYAGAISGNGVLGTAGAGVVTISNPANSFTGDIVVGGSTLIAASDAALGNLNNRVSLIGNAVFVPAAGFTSTNRNFSVVQYISNPNFPAAPVNFLTSGDFTLNGTLATLQFNANSGFSFSQFAKLGTGTLTLTAANTLSGIVSIGETSGSTPRLAGAAVTFGGAIRLAGANGGLPLANGYTINEGASLIVDNTTAVNNSRMSTTTLTVNNGSFHLIGNAIANTNPLTGNLLVGNGAANITLTQPVSAGSGQVTTLNTTWIGGLNDTNGLPIYQVSSFGTLFVRGTNFGGTTGDRTQYLVNANPLNAYPPPPPSPPPPQTIVVGVVVATSVSSAPTDFTTATPVGSQFSILPLAPAGYGSILTAPDATTVADQTGSVAVLPAATDVLLNALRIGAGGGVDLNGNLLHLGGATLNAQAGMVLATGANAGIVNGTINFAAQPARFITPSDLAVGSSAQPVAITQSTTGFNSTLVKTGAGTLTLFGTAASNVGRSGIVVGEGTLVLGNANAVATAPFGTGSVAVPNVVATPRIMTGGTLDINNQTLNVAGFFSSGTIALGTGTVYLNGNSQIAGSMTGTASSKFVLGFPWATVPGNTFNSSQNIPLSGDNSGFSGQFVVLNGILRVLTPTALGSGTSPVLLGDTAGTNAATIQIGDTLSVFNKDITVQAGSVGLASINTFASASVNLAGTITMNRNLLLGGAASSGLMGAVQTVSGRITGPGQLFLYPGLNSAGNSAGNYALLNPANDYAGGTFLNAGQTAGTNTHYATVGVGANTVFGPAPITVGSFAGYLKAENGARTIANNLNLVQTVNGSANTYGNMMFGSTGQNDLTLSGNVTPVSAMPNHVNVGTTLTLNGISRGATTFSGVISSGGLPSLGIVKNGPGTIMLGNANTYSGNTVINAGTLKLGHASALGNGGRIATVSPVSTQTINGGTTVAAGAVLDLNGQQGVVELFTLAGGSLINSNSATPAIISGGRVSSVTYTTASGTIAAVPTVSLTGGDGSGAGVAPSLGLTAASFAVTANGSGYDLRSTSTTSGVPTVTITGADGVGASVTPRYGLTPQSYLIANPGAGYNDGSYNISFSTPSGGTAAVGTFTVSGGSVTAINITAPGMGYTTVPSIFISGAGTPTTSASFSRIDGYAVITGVALAASGADYTPAGMAGATFAFSTNTTYGTPASGTLNNTNYTLGLKVTNSGSGYTTAPTVGFTGAGAAAATLNLTAINLTATSNAGGDGDLQIDSNIAGTGFGIVKIGDGTLTLNGANTYTGGTTLNGGALALGGANAIGTTGTIGFGGGALRFTAANTTDYSPRFSTADNQQYSFDTNGQAVTLASDLTSNGGSLTKSGAGTLTLTGANTYTNGTNINGGTLALGSAGAIGSAGTIGFVGGTLQFSAANTTDYSARFSNAPGQAYSLDTNGQSVTLASNLTSVGGSLTKTGAGTLTLTGANAFTGGTSINGGTLALASAGALGSAGTIGFGGGTLQFSAANTADYSGRFSNAPGQAYRLDTNGQSVTLASNLTSVGGSLTKLGAGELILTGANSYSGVTHVTAGTLTVNNSLSGTSGNVQITGGATMIATGVIPGSVTAVADDRTAIVKADGGLAMGNSSITFDFKGTLNIGANAVAVVSNGPSFLKYVTMNNDGTLGGSNGIVFRSLTGSTFPGITLATGPSATIDSNVSLGQSGIEDQRTYIKVADGATLHFSGVVKGNVTQVLEPGFTTGTIQYDGLRKSGFSPGYSSYGSRNYAVGATEFYLWGTTPAAPGTPSSVPYYSNDLVQGVGTLPAAGSANIGLRFGDEVTGPKYTPVSGDAFTIIHTANGGSIANTGGMDVASLYFPDINLTALHLTPLLNVVTGVNGFVQVRFLDSFTWRNGDVTDPDNFNGPDNWMGGAVPNVNQVAVFDHNVINYNGGNVDVQVNRTVGGMTFATSGTGGYTLTTANNRVLTLNNGTTATIAVNSANHEIAPRMTLTSNLAVAVNNAASTLKISGAIGQSTAGRTLTKTGPGTLVLDGVNTYTGLTAVAGGALRGSGTIAGPVTVQGAIGGGSTGVGTLTLANGLTLDAASKLLVALAGTPVPGAASTGDSTNSVPNPSTNNYLNITGGSSVINPLTTIQVDATGATLTAPNSYSFKVAGGAGNQSGLNITSAGQFAFLGAMVDPSSVSLTGDLGGTIYLNFSTVVPEPGLFIGLAGLAILGLRRRR